MNAARMTWLGAAAILLAGPLAQGQAQYGFYPRYPGYGTPAYQAYVGYARASAAAAVNRAYTWGAYGNPYAYWGTYGNPTGYWGYTPTLVYEPYGGGYLRGAADVIGAQSRYLISIQEANLLREQVRARQIENRRSAFDHYLYVRENTPSPEQLRSEERTQRRDRARNDPPVTEIFSAVSLNDLLADLQQVSLTGVRDLPLDADIVRRVNLTSNRNGSNIGVVRNAGR